MGSPMMFANPFSVCSNYLLNPKPGEKRPFFNTKLLSKKQPHTKSVPYVDLIGVLADLPHKLVETDMGNPYLKTTDMGNIYLKTCNKIPFQVPIPPMKMPSLIGGYVGAKSQSSREESSKLCDILANSLMFGKNILNMHNTEGLSNKCKDINNYDCMDKQNKESSASIKNQQCSPVTVAIKKECMALPQEQPLSGKPDLLINLKTSSPTENLVFPHVTPNKQYDDSHGFDKGKPPVKKPKLNLKTCSSPRKKHKGRRKKCVKKVKCDSSVTTPPGYDPTQSSFEYMDEIDCGIELSNRFAPLEDITTFHMWSESPSDLDFSEMPILDKLNQMHLDDFEVNFDSSSPSVEILNVCSYERTDSPMTCNSSIAFILGGNDDVLTSDSEDSGSFASDLDDLQWQSFKTDFEFLQDQIPLQNFIAESCALNSVRFETSFDEVDDDSFLSDLEYHPTCDAEQRLKEINLRWKQIVGSDDQKPTQTKVCFAPDNCLTSVHYIPSGPEECQARKSSWDQCYLDRCRFERRIQEVEPVISLCLTPQHRKSVFQRLFGSQKN